jgi:hypothetical protein
MLEQLLTFSYLYVYVHSLIRMRGRVYILRKPQSDKPHARYRKFAGPCVAETYGKFFIHTNSVVP